MSRLERLCLRLVLVSVSHRNDRFAFGHYSNYAKVAELEKLLQQEEVLPQDHDGTGEEVVGERRKMGGRKGDVAPLEVLRKIPPVVGGLVVSVLCRLFTWLAK